MHMEKNKINNIENNYQITNKEEHSEHKSKGIYIRDDHCDWGSSGMNEFTEEYSSNLKLVISSHLFKKREV